jgi:PAS domain S-box-containing protein
VALRKSEEMYRLMADNTVDGVWQMNLDFEFTYVNPSIIQMLGFTQEEWIGSSLFDHCSSEDIEFILNLAKDMLKKGPESSGETFEMQLLHKNGEKIDVEITTKLLFDDEGNPVGNQGATRNITERKRAEEKLKRLTLSLQEHVKELEESKRKIAEAYSLREYFLKETSHRIITPVAIIGGYTDLLLESSNLDDDQKQKLRLVREKDAEIQQLVNDSLAGKYLVEEE